MEDIGPDKIEGAPFAEHLKTSNVFDESGEVELLKLKELESLPHKIIRVETFDEINERYGGEKSAMELVPLAKKLYDELGEKYGINVSVDFIIGKNEEGEKVVYSIVDKIEGENLTQTEKSAEVAKQVASLYASLAKYHLDKFQTGESFLYDINGPQQYVYGKKFGDKEDNIHLVDTDIFVGDNKTTLLIQLRLLAIYINGNEKRFNTKFNKARELLRESIELPASQDLDAVDADTVFHYETIEDIRNLLKDKNTDTVLSSSITSFE